MSQPIQDDWMTPKGHPVRLWYRDGTNDWNTLSSILTHDEYHLANLSISGWALDVGAHIGGVSVALAKDNPDCRVVAIEPVPENADLIRWNARDNGLEERISVIQGAAGKGGESVDVWYGYRGKEAAEHHRFIGNSSLAYDEGGPLAHDTVTYEAQGLADGEWEFVKIDCEGCEYAFLSSPNIGNAKIIRGEFHPVRGHRRKDIARLLSRTHVVTFPDPPAGVSPLIGPGPFEAVRR